MTKPMSKPMIIDTKLTSGDGVMVARPLFPTEGQGSIPMSPLQFNIEYISKNKFITLNKLWHSRLPKCDAVGIGLCLTFGAVYKNVIFAVAWWSSPIDRSMDSVYVLELKRMACSEYCPKNTPSRFLSVMTRIIKRDYPYVCKLVSYQDTEVHQGTIYKADNWICTGETKGYTLDRLSRSSRITQTTAPKKRWEKIIRPFPNNETIKSDISQMDLF